MIIRILVIFLITFTPINCIPCKENPNCDCSSNGLDEININCKFKNSIGFDVTIKSRNNLKIVCTNWSGWEDFYIRNYNSDKVIESLSFDKCELSNKISLKDLVKQFGVRGTKNLKFSSYKSLYQSLKKDHLQGFKYLKEIDLSHNGLTNIPSDLFLDCPHLEYIKLSNNNIVLPANIFNATPNLREINLASSGADVIHVGTFNNLNKLEVLNIMSNNINKIKAGTFSQLISLKVLNLADNKLSDLPLNIFYDLKALKKLDISMNKFSSIQPKLFVKNRKLEELYLHNNVKKLKTLPDNLLANFSKLYQVYLNNNGFKYLPENLFWGSTSLEYIYLDDNSLDTLPKNIFRGLTNVTLLSIKNNKLETLPDKIFEDMENLKAFDLSNNLIARVSSDLFYGLVSLEELNMERNQLKSIDRNAFINLINLRIAKFSHNPLRLTYVKEKFSVFYSNLFLKELQLSNCSIKYFFDDWLIGNSEFKFVNLSHNFITKVSTSSLLFRNRYWESRKISIDLRYNNITNFPLALIENIERLNIKKSYVIIYMDHNPISCDCSLYDLLRYNERKTPNSVYYSFNIVLGNLTCIQRDGSNKIEIRNLNSSTYLCSEHEYFNTTKRCQDGCTCSVRPSDQISFLNCSDKNMSKFLFDETKVNIQTNYSFIINFTGNSLTEIPSIKTMYPINITSLLLSSNKISRITLDRLPRSLQVLELRNNSISRIDTFVLDYLKSLHLKELTLSGNPIICDCDNQDLISFLKESRLLYKDIENIKCKDTDIPLDKVEPSNLCFSGIYHDPSEYWIAFFATIIFIMYIFSQIHGIRLLLYRD